MKALIMSYCKTVCQHKHVFSSLVHTCQHLYKSYMYKHCGIVEFNKSSLWHIWCFSRSGIKSKIQLVQIEVDLFSPS